jgi:hypothetical protein
LSESNQGKPAADTIRMTTPGDDHPGDGYSEAWRARVAADLEAYRTEQQRLWGGIDELALARYEAGVCTDAERAGLEQAMRDHPALRECMDIARELSAQAETAGSPSDAVRHKPDWQATRYQPAPANRFRQRSLRLLVGIGSGLAAAVLLGLLLQQQASIRRLKYDLQDMGRKNFDLQAMLTDVRKQQTRPGVIRNDTPPDPPPLVPVPDIPQKAPLIPQKATEEKTPVRPAGTILLTGRGETNAQPYSFAIWLQYQDNGPYVGVIFPTDQPEYVRPTRINGVFDKETWTFTIKVTPTQPPGFVKLPSFARAIIGTHNGDIEKAISQLSAIMTIKPKLDTGEFEGSCLGSPITGRVITHEDTLTRVYPRRPSGR